MRFMPRAAAAVLLASMLPASAAGQTTPAAAESRPVEPSLRPVGSSFPVDVIRDLPLGDNVYSLLETTQSEVISDRFNSGGLNVGGDTRVGGFLGSWSQTLFRIGDFDVSDPGGSGASLIFPDATLWQRVDVTTGLMPAAINTPGLAVTMEPRRAGNRWTTELTGSGTGGSLVAGAPANQPIPIARLKDFAHGSAVLSGPFSGRASIAAGGSVARGSSYAREQLAATDSSIATAFAHLTFTPSAGREWRLLGIAQRGESPFENWQAFEAPSASTKNTAVHVQTTLESRSGDGAGWRVFGGVTQRDRTNAVNASLVRVNRIVDGPVAPLVDTVADDTARRIAIGGRVALAQSASARHHVDAGVDLDRATTELSDGFSGIVRESVDTVPARIWTYSSSASASNRAVTRAAAFVSDRIALSPTMSVDAGLRAEAIRGSADGAGTDINWVSLLPHAYLRWEMSAQRAFVFGYARSGNALTQNWLAFGDPSAATATVASASTPSVIVSRVGPGTGGNASISAIDDNLKRPYTDEFTIGYEKRRSESTRYTLTGIARRETNLLGVVNTGTSAASYSTIALQDAGKDLTDPSDDRLLLVYNRLPSSFAQDTYLLTNPGQEAATAYALRMSFEHATDRLFLLFGATASAAQGAGGNRGYGPLENDQDVPGELFTNPNGASYARGRLFSDRAFTIKWTTLYRFPGDFTVGGIARYQDGQPFSRLVLVPGLNQGAEAVQAYPNAGSRYTFTGTLDLRVQKGFRFGRNRVDVFLDAYNLLTRNNEVEEYVVSGPEFRTSTAIEPPHSVHLGLRLTF